MSVSGTCVFCYLYFNNMWWIFSVDFISLESDLIKVTRLDIGANCTFIFELKQNMLNLFKNCQKHMCMDISLNYGSASFFFNQNRSSFFLLFPPCGSSFFLFLPCVGKVFVFFSHVWVKLFFLEKLPAHPLEV